MINKTTWAKSCSKEEKLNQLWQRIKEFERNSAQVN